MTDIDPYEANHKRLECVIPHNPELAWNWTELWYPRCVITTKLSISPRSVGGISQNIWATSQIGDFACLTCGLSVNRFPLLPMSWQQLPNLGLLWPWFCSYSMTKDLACSTTAMCFFGWIPQFFTVWHLHLHAASYWKSSPRHIPVWIVWPPSAAPSCHLGSTPGMQKSPHKFPATPVWFAAIHIRS